MQCRPLAISARSTTTCVVALLLALLVFMLLFSGFDDPALSFTEAFHDPVTFFRDRNHSKPRLTKPRYIFVDLGANSADSLETFLQRPGAKFDYEFPRPEWATREQAEIYLFEANPHFNTALVQAKERYDAQGIQVHIFPSTIVSHVDGTRTLFLDTVNAKHDFWGSSTYSNHPDVARSGSNGTQLTSINIARWLLMNTRPSDFVVVKMDIEGAEFDILPHMAEMSAWTVIDHLFIEWHRNLASDEVLQRADAAAEKLKREGVNMPAYDSPA